MYGYVLGLDHCVKVMRICGGSVLLMNTLSHSDKSSKTLYTPCVI